MEYSTEEITFLLTGLEHLVERDTVWRTPVTRLRRTA